MRTIVLAVSVLASLAAPAFAAGHRHTAMPAGASDFLGSAQDNGQRGDRTSPRLTDGSSHCAWTAVCGY